MSIEEDSKTIENANKFGAVISKIIFMIDLFELLGSNCDKKSSGVLHSFVGFTQRELLFPSINIALHNIFHPYKPKNSNSISLEKTILNLEEEIQNQENYKELKQVFEDLKQKSYYKKVTKIIRNNFIGHLCHIEEPLEVKLDSDLKEIRQDMKILLKALEKVNNKIICRSALDEFQFVRSSYKQIIKQAKETDYSSKN